jgi:hypothetical protein
MTKHGGDRRMKRGIIPRPSADEDPNALKSAGVQQAQVGKLSSGINLSLNIIMTN